MKDGSNSRKKVLGLDDPTLMYAIDSDEEDEATGGKG